VGAVATEVSIETARMHGLDEATFGARNGMGRVGQPDEIGHIVLFLASDAASFMTGQVLIADGGLVPH
jgi:NAD(P)-dependent dehydrogenase (short-subunit alcohol dehydrogenase family)